MKKLVLATLMALAMVTTPGVSQAWGRFHSGFYYGASYWQGPSYGGYYYRRVDDDDFDGGGLAFGLLFGTMLGQALAPPVYYYSPPPVYYYPAPPAYYYSPPPTAYYYAPPPRRLYYCEDGDGNYYRMPVSQCPPGWLRPVPGT